MELEKILCPGCGEAMSLCVLGYRSDAAPGYHYHCNACGWSWRLKKDSPLKSA